MRIKSIVFVGGSKGSLLIIEAGKSIHPAKMVHIERSQGECSREPVDEVMGNDESGKRCGVV